MIYRDSLPDCPGMGHNGAENSRAYDLVVRNGTIINGSGMPRYRADAGVKEGRLPEVISACRRGPLARH